MDAAHTEWEQFFNFMRFIISISRSWLFLQLELYKNSPFFRISVHKPIEIAKMLNAYTQPSQLVADSKVKPADGTAQPQHRGLLQIVPRDYLPLASRRVTTVCGVQCVRAEHSLDPGPRALPTYIPTTVGSRSLAVRYGIWRQQNDNVQYARDLSRSSRFQLHTYTRPPVLIFCLTAVHRQFVVYIFVSSARW